MTSIRYFTGTRLGCSSLAVNVETQVHEVDGTGREALDQILDTSFEGWYLRHSKRTLREIETVFAARLGDADVGLSMLKKLDSKTGYIYYMAVLPEYRGKKVGGKLLDRSLAFLSDQNVNVVFASLMQEHEEANFLFKSRGFSQTSFGEIARRFGKLHALNMYRKMVVVTGEVVVFKELSSKLEDMRS
jgi:ribosomal protein S18 acetylase RimI-like enzyme